MTSLRQVLIVKTSSLGDLVHTLPAVSDMVRHVPSLQIDWVAEESFADIPVFHPKVRRVIPVALRRWRHHPLQRMVWREFAVFREGLRASHYDIVLDHQGLIKSAAVACLARGERWGFDWQSAREPLASVCYHQHCAVAQGQHAVVRNRALAACALGYEVPTSPPEYGIAPPSLPRLVDYVLPERYVVLLHATSRVSKTWPKGHWIDLGATLAAQGWSCVLPWGNEAERLVAAELAAVIPCAAVLPRCRLRELAGILVGAGFVIGTDTGLTHLAAALGCPTVALYTDTEPGLTGVMAGRLGWARNLGAPGQVPTPDQALLALREGTTV